MYVNINRGACLLRLQRYFILKRRARSSQCCGLALSLGLVLNTELTLLRCTAFVKKVLPKIIFQ